MEPKKIPEIFRSILWSFDFNSLDAARDERRIIINAINYGAWPHWLWIAHHYGKPAVAQVIKNTPASEFRAGALKLARILFGAERPIHAYRSTAG